MKRFIHTNIQIRWNEETQRFESISSEGYWYDGPVALAAAEVREWTDWAFYDDGTEAGSVIIGAENTNPTLGTDTTYFFRCGVHETGNSNWRAVDQSIRLEFNHNGGGWEDAGVGQVIQVGLSANVADNDDCTQRMTSYTFVSDNDGVCENALVHWNGVSTFKDDGAEILFAIKIDDAQVSSSDTIELRLWDQNVGNTLDIVNQTNPTITVSAAIREWTDWAFYNDGTESGSVIIGAKNSNPTLDLDTTYFFRCGVHETAGIDWTTANQNAQLQFNHNGGGWQDAAAGRAIRLGPSANISHLDDCTQRLTSYTFVSDNDGVTEISTVKWSGGNAVFNNSGAEVLFSIQASSANVSADDTIELRLFDDIEADLFDAVNQTNPTITIASANITGTSATINADDTQAAAGTLTNAGTSTTTNINDTQAAAGILTNSGTSITTNNNDTQAATGVVGLSGSSATTNADDAQAASGTLSNSGTSATTNQDDTQAATGTLTNSGTAATTNDDDTQAATGVVGVSGSSATTNADDTQAASGTLTNSGTSATTNADDAQAAAGTLTNSGSSATTNSDDTQSAAGIVGLDVTGTSITTNADDTQAASGTLTASGSSATTNDDDTQTASGILDNAGTSATTNNDDTQAATGFVGQDIIGTSITTNADDTQSAAGTIANSGSSATTNSDDAQAASGTVSSIGSSATTNQDDTQAAAGTSTAIGSSATTNADDIQAASGTVSIGGITGTSETTNANDVSAGTGVLTNSGTSATTNANDVQSATGLVGVLTGTGLEYTVPSNDMDYTLPSGKLHFTIGEN